MKSHRFFGISLILIAAAFFAAGCGQSQDAIVGSGADDISGDNSMSELDLNKSYGGLSYTDEPAAFADEILLAEDAADLAAANDDDETDVVEGDPARYTRTYLRILWGQLDGRPEGDELRTDAERDCTPVDWQGSLTVTEGGVAIKRLLRFERPLDHRVPRDSRESVGWHSFTCPASDGILVCVLSEAAEDGSLPGEITFSTGPLTQTFAIADLDGLDETITVDDMGNAVSFLGVTDLPDRCPSGFLGGHWQASRDDEHQGGWFRGRLTNPAGKLRAHIMGRYGVNDAGENVFAAKIIGHGGAILGLAQGTYEASGDTDGTGSFMGRWVNRNETHMGTLAGRYMTVPNRGAGFFKGVWEEVCDSNEEDDGAL